MRSVVLNRSVGVRRAGTGVLFAGMVMVSVALAGCSGAGATKAPSGGATTPPPAGATATVTASAPPTISVTPAPSCGCTLGAIRSQPPAVAGPTGQPITGSSQFAQVLGPGDFGAVGLAGAEAPTVNTTGCSPNCAYIVYRNKSAADGGYELDIFNFTSSSDAAADYGDQSNDQLDAASLAALGADRAQLLLAQPGNSTDISVDELRVLKGKLWFDLGIPSSAQGKAQLLALAALVLARTGPLQ